jgi:hypothetical protein
MPEPLLECLELQGTGARRGVAYDRFRAIALELDGFVMRSAGHVRMHAVQLA